MGLDASVDLRAMVREVLREAIATRAAPVSGEQAVTISTDADLQAFITRLAAPGSIEAVRAGTLKFTLSGPTASVTGMPNTPVRPVMDGVISERKLQGKAAGSTVTLTASAVLTPMAKDMARRLGLTFERIG